MLKPLRPNRLIQGDDRQQVRLIQFSITASGIAISPTTSMHRIFPLSMPAFTGTLAN
ncbi:MAG: hypothetical protein U0175_07255 [Caldilineaceae bacterium]